MELHNLKPAENSTRSRKRIARGQGAGTGGTSTRGHKGAKSRSGYKRKKGFEGGQMPLQRRVPKKGFKNPNRVDFRVFNLDQLQLISEKHKLTAINPDSLCEVGLAKSSDLIKILGRGEVSTKLDVTAHKFSQTASSAIEEKGGTANLI